MTPFFSMTVMSIAQVCRKENIEIYEEIYTQIFVDNVDNVENIKSSICVVRSI